MTRRGRPPGSTSAWKNPVSRAANFGNLLMEAWLAGVPIQVRPDRWLPLPTERRYTVPPRYKRVLAQMAVNYEKSLYPDVKLSVDQVLAQMSRRAPSISLRRKARARKSRK